MLSIVEKTDGETHFREGRGRNTKNFDDAEVTQSCCVLNIYFSSFRLHDRKLCVLGLCILIDTPHTRHQAITDNAQTIVPALLLLFSGLKRAYSSRAEDDDSDSEEEDEDGIEGLSIDSGNRKTNLVK